MTVAPGATILVVDDSESGRYLKAHMLRRAGYNVLEAASGTEALRLVGQHGPAVVLLDVKLPDINGFDVCRKIKEGKSSTLVLQTSAAFIGKQDRAAGLAGGADSYLIEPFESEELIATVQSLVRLYQAEQELRRNNETLEQRVADRVREIEEINRRLESEVQQRSAAEDILRHTQKLDVLGQLTGGISHDFNNLLTIILGNLETLRRRLESPNLDLARLRSAADNAYLGAQRAAAVTKRLLSFSRRQSLEMKPLDLNAQIGTMTDILQRLLGEGVAIETALADDLWLVHTDFSELENAILNLAVNARDAMKAGGRLTISTENVDFSSAAAAEGARVSPGLYVALSLRDNGSGMSESVLSYAFEPFFTTKDIGHGTGLGLSQVYGFVTQSGGHAQIQSKLGEGTTVTLYLPRYVAGSAAEAPEPPAETASASGRKQTLLVVEDDKDVRAYSTEILQELGYRVLQATNGADAIDLLERRPDIQLLFTDIGLPGGMSGRDLASEALRRRSDLKVLLTTGYARFAGLPEEDSAPSVPLIPKPFSQAALGKKIHEILGADGERPCILVAEDEALIRAGVVDQLDELGFNVEEAKSASEAMTKLQGAARPLAAVIIDVGLPDRKGDELAAEFRTMLADLPIVIMSGYGEGMFRDRFAADSHMAFLGKPYGSAQLAAVLMQLGVAGNPAPRAAH